MKETPNPHPGGQNQSELQTAGDHLGVFGFRRSHLSAGGFALLLAGLVFIAFPQVLLGLETFFLRDFGLFVYPLAHYQRQCFWRGELPFWNPFNNCGVPFLAQWNTMPLYPPALIYLLLPLNWSLPFFDLLHLWFAGLGMYFLARRWAGNHLAASIAGLVFAFNGLSLNLLMWPSHMATLSWMPWVLLAVERAWAEGGRRIIVAALVGAMQMLAGGPETIMLTWLLLAALCVSECVQVQRARPQIHSQVSNGRSPQMAIEGVGTPRASCVPIGMRFGVVVVLVAGLAAAQLLPFLDLAAHSQRLRGYADTSWSLPARGWANFLVPMVFGSTWNQDVFFQYDQYWTSSYYVGVGTLLLALLAVWQVNDRRVRLLAGAAAVAFICALGDQTFIYPWLRRLLPQLTLISYPVKFVTVIVFAAPLLAAFALAPLRADPGARKPFEKRVAIGTGLLLVLIAVILVWARNFPHRLDDFPATLRNGLSRAAFLVSTAVVLVLMGRTRNGRWQRLVPLVLLPVFWLDLWTHEPAQNPSVSSGIYQTGMVRRELAMNPQPALGVARVMVSPAADEALNMVHVKNLREGYLAKRLGYFSNCNLLDDVPKVNGFFSLYPRESAAVNLLLYGSTNSFPWLEDFLSVAYVTAPGEFTQWEPRVSYLPWATAGQQPVFLDEVNTLKRLVAPDFDPSKVVLLPLSAEALVSVTNQTKARVLSGYFSAQQVELQVEADNPSLVVLSQTYYHNWHAYVDEQPTPLLRANYGFQAVQVPEGKHGVRLVYRDKAFQIGTAISSLALLVSLAGCARSR